MQPLRLKRCKTISHYTVV